MSILQLTRRVRRARTTVMSALLVSSMFGQDLRASNAKVEEHLRQVRDGLPGYSTLRTFLGQGIRGTGIEQPYMSRMRDEHVKRALIEVRALWRNGRPQDLVVASRMYFDEYDGPRTRIIERERLEEIRSSGLEATLDQAALDRMGRSRPLYIDKQPRLKGKRVYGYVELYDDPWLFETPVSPAPEDKRPSLLEQAAVIGDSLQVGDILRRKTFSEGDLNRALWLAIYEYRDNTDVIELLLDNGANANARGADGVTPLMAAIQRPAHVEVLLTKGARVRDRDRYGRDALELAQRAGDRDSVELLRNAASR